MTTQPLLSVRDLRISYSSALRSGTAVDGLSFDLMPGEALTLVGESGCGKSTLALALMGLLPRDTALSGEIRFEGRDLVTADARELRALRGPGMAMIFQEPMTSLNPVYTIGSQIAEALRAHTDITRADARRRVLELLDQVAIADSARRIDAFPHELSGGQRQRAMIAMAIALKPRLLIADEPTTALDSTTQQQILDLIDQLRHELDMSLLMISHDLPLVQRRSDRVIVMHHGRQMEEIAAAELFESGRHIYTRGLIAASIRLGDGRHYSTERLSEIRATREPDGDFRFDLHMPDRAPPAPPEAGPVPALSVAGLVVHYPGTADPAVRDVSFDISRGTTLGLVGESGSGKSSLSKAVMRLIPGVSGQIRLLGQDITAAKGRALHQARRRLQMVFQDPYASLNPRQTVGDILGHALALHGLDHPAQRIARMVDHVGLPAGSLERYPHEFSGGQRQRIGIARALILEPEVVICDEPVSALDVSIQAQILNLLTDLRAELGLSMLFISHDLAVVQYISDRVAVMQRGRIVELGDHRSLWQAPQHDYTRALIAAVH